MELVEGGEILARFPSDVILAAEITPGVDELIARNKDRIPPGQLEAQRELLIQQRLQQQIESKLIYLDAKRSIPEENFPFIEKRLGEQFEEVELKRMMERTKVQTRDELDRKLRSLGTSLGREKRAFTQRSLAQQWIRQQVKFDEEITYDQMREYYNEHLAEFEHPARARWQQLTARFSKYASKAEAHAAIAGMGNMILGGAAFEQVAKTHSNGVTAADGGLRDWTTKESLVSETLDRALFALPVGSLSPILEDEDSFHIIRVIEREDASRTPFLEAQVEIEPKIRKQRTQEQLRAYVLRLKEQIPVWTIYDDRSGNQQISGRPATPKR